MSRMSHRMRVISGGRMLHMSPLPVRVTDRTRRGRPSLSEIAPRQERSDFFSRRHVGGSGLSPWRRSARQVECRPGTPLHVLISIYRVHRRSGGHSPLIGQMAAPPAAKGTSGKVERNRRRRARPSSASKKEENEESLVQLM
jgi:hypothetical protein